VKIDTATGAVAAVLVLNEESNPPTTFVREPGTSRGYVLLSRTNEAVEIDLNSARATRVVQLPLSLPISSGLARHSGMRTHSWWRRETTSWNWLRT